MTVKASPAPAAPSQSVSTAAGQKEGLFSVSNLVASHGKTIIVKGISFELPKRSCLALVGQSGSGKTTTARTLAGLHTNATGVVQLGDKIINLQRYLRTSELRRKIQYVFQNPYASLNPSRTVGKSLAVAARQFYPDLRKDIDKTVMRVLDQVALPSYIATRLPSELSGGQRQRAAIGRALIAKPELLICDEVTSALDVSVQAVIVELLKELQQSGGLSIIFVTHDLGLARNIADTTAVLEAGNIVEIGASCDLLLNPRAPETLRLLEDAPRLALA